MACRSVRQKRPHRDRTPLDVMDRVLDKGIVIDLGEQRTDASAR